MPEDDSNIRSVRGLRVYEAAMNGGETFEPANAFPDEESTRWSTTCGACPGPCAPTSEKRGVDTETEGNLDERNDRILGKLVRLVHEAEDWTIRN